MTNDLERSWRGAGFAAFRYEHHTVLSNSLSSIAIPNHELDSVARGLLELSKSK